MTSKTFDRDAFHMRKALRLAAGGAGRTSPNPMVGAVVAHEDAVVGEGFHEFVGGPHAEVNALRQAGRRARGATLYVTLEPCNHYGRTPPCAEAVIKAGISRVVVGMADPNPHVEGGGSDRLRKSGLIVDEGVLEKDCRKLNQAFLKHVSTGMPYVILKAAATLDGFIATSSGHSRWISNERSRRFVHHMRRSTDAILVGVETALADDPELTARLGSKTVHRPPARIVLDSRLRIEPDSRLVTTAGDVPLWIACGMDAPQDKEDILTRSGALVLRFPVERGGIDLRALLGELGKRRITSILVEGGASVHGSFLEQRLADELYLFYAPRLLGDPAGVPIFRAGARERMSDAFPLHDLRIRRFGSDIMVTGRFNERLY